MIFRNKRVITVAVVCHLLLCSRVFTSELRLPVGIEVVLAAQSQKVKVIPDAQPGAVLQRPEASLPEGDPDVVNIKAKSQEKEGEIYRLKGDVEIEFRDLVLRGDDVVYNRQTGDVIASGHLSMDGGPNDEHIEASRAEYNVRTRTGKFYDVVGTTGVRFQGKNVMLTSTDPFAFTGKVVEQVGPERYIVHDGTVTSCKLDEPKWTFNAKRVVIDVGGTAKIYNSTLRVKKVPVFFLPFTAHPVANLGRQSGFLVPTFGASSRKGTILGESFYWAINRNMDATIGAEMYSSRGWAQHGEFRIKPTETSYLNLNYFGVLDRGLGALKVDQGGQDIKLNGEAEFPHGIRGVASINYLSSFVFRLAFTETFAQAVNSEVKSVGFLTKSYKGFFLNTLAERYQNFQSTLRGDLVTILRMPSFEINSVDRRLAKTPVYWALSGAIEGVSRKEPSFVTNDLVGRFDVHPSGSIPLFLHGWTLRPEIGLRNTYYTQRKSPVGATVGTPLNDALNRKALDFNVELRPPTLGRIFEKPVFGRTLKHTIESRITYRLVDGVSGFNNVIRFDERDILSNTNEIEFAVVQRLFLKPIKDNCKDKLPGESCDNGPREFITWEVAQRYYFDPNFGGAIVNGKRNVLTTTADFTGIAFLTEPRRFSPIVSRLRVRATSNVDASWQLDYDTKKGRINASTVFVNYRLGDFFLGGSHAFLRAPGEIFVSNPIPGPDQFNQFRVLAGYGGPNKRGWSTAASLGFDSNREFLQYGSLQGSYNWDCCGISSEYRRFALGTVRNENQFRFAFTLANIGTFGNMKRQERLF